MYGKAPASIQWFDKYATYVASQVKYYWGARAIFHGRDKFDIVHDRQQIEYASAKERAQLAEWVNKHGLGHLRNLLKKNDLPTNSTKEVRLEVDGYYIYATPNASCGYLYISIWKVPNIKLPDNL